MTTMRGFTLIELVMVLILMGIISVVVGKTLFHGFQTSVVTKDIADIDWQANMVLSRMTIDAHRIRSTSDISTMSTSQFAFIDTTGTTVTYALSGSNLLRNGQVLASNISSLTLAYLDRNGSATGDANQLAYLSINVTATKNTISSSFATLVGVRSMV